MFGDDDMKASFTQSNREFAKSGLGDQSVSERRGQKTTRHKGGPLSWRGIRPAPTSRERKDMKPPLVPFDDSGHSSCWIPIDFGDDNDGSMLPSITPLDDSICSYGEDDASTRHRSQSFGTTTKRRTTRSEPSDGTFLMSSSGRSDRSSQKDCCQKVSSHRTLSGNIADSFHDYESDESIENKAPIRSLSWGSNGSERKHVRFWRENPSNSLSVFLQRFRYSKFARQFMAKLYLLGPAIQTVFVVGFLILVVRSRRSVAIFEEQLRTYNHETSSLLLKVQRIEQNSQTLHKHIGHHLGEAGMGTVGELGVMPFLSEDLHEKAFELQEAIQERDYANIVERYGEGPIKVVFDLGLGASLSDESSKGSTTLDIVLWSDTPHASWTLLDQIERSVWDGAQFHWNSKLAALEISPAHDDPQGRGLLEFAEHISNEENWHDVWTVGLRQDPDTRKLQLFFNLKDNSYFQEHETCIGRVLGGFVALQTALRSANARETNDGKLPSISVQSAVAKHLTRREIDMATK